MSPRRKRRAAGSNRWAIWLVASAGAAAVLLALWVILTQLPGAADAPDQAATQAPAVQTSPAPVDEDAPTISATLYFVSSNGAELVGITQEVPYEETALEQARRIADAQVAGPPSHLRSAIPAGTTVRSVFLTERGEAYLDLSRDFVTGHSGGSLNETLAVYALVNAMTANLPDVSAVQILIDGREVDTLAGHLDLRHPLRRSDSWVQRGP